MLWLERFRAWLHRSRKRLAGGAWRAPATGCALLIVAAVAFRWARSAAGFWSIDDAAVTYAAAFQLADHGSLATYVGGTPIEGYSNPLLFFVVTLLRLFRLFDSITTHVLLETIVFAWMVMLVWSMLRSRAGEIAAVVAALVFAAIELVTPATWIWYGSGLENVWVSAGLVQLLWIVDRSSRHGALRPAWGAVAFLVAIVRPEAPVYVAAFYIALALFGRSSTVTLWDHARQVGRALVVTTTLYGVFLCWRRYAYGDWLPNTYYAKLAGDARLAANLRGYVIGAVLPYCRAALFAGSVLALLVAPTMQGLAPSVLLMLIASLAMPLTAGADWMGEHRFATPFFAMCHASYAALVAVCVGGLTHVRPRQWTATRVIAAVAVFVVPALLKFDRLAVRDHIPLHNVTIAKVAESQGGKRWEDQARLGVVNPVVLLPDAGGSLLVGAMQLVDDGYLTDFQMARIGRNFSSATDLRVLDQYEIEERNPDLIDTNPNWPIDVGYLGTRYHSAEGVLLARRDLFEVTKIEPAAQLLYDDGHLRLYLSDETVRTAAPSALVRCELIVEWTGGPPDKQTDVRGSIDGGDRDEISLAPYVPSAAGSERRALLLGAPDHAGSFEVSIELVRNGTVTFGRRVFTLETTADEGQYERAAGQILTGAAPLSVARRIGRLREQLLPRLGMTAFHATLEELHRADAEHSSEAASALNRLRWHVRLAGFERLPSSIRNAEGVAVRRAIAACPGRGAEPERRVLCIGRTTDQLRRYGYLDPLSRVPEVSQELVRARHSLESMTPVARYQELVGLTLALPADISLQRALLRRRRELSAYPKI